MNEIQLVQKPIITHKLKEVGKSISERIEKLNIPNLVANEDTLKYLKDTRATLNKEYDELENGRKTIKKEVNKPYDEFDAEYKSEVSDRYIPALGMLKEKISSVEISVNDAKKQVITAYLNELCASEKIDFIKFENTGFEINLSTTEKTYKEKCNEFISKVVDDLGLIKSMEFEAEIMAEYKTTLNVAKSIQTINERKERERIEAERIRISEWNRRMAEFSLLKMFYDKMTDSFIYDNEIYIPVSSIKDLDKLAFSSKIVELEEKIKASKLKDPILTLGKPDTTIDFAKQNVVNAEIKPILSAPIVEPKQELLTASFEVIGTMHQLLALKEYLKSNNLTYKNL